MIHKLATFMLHLLAIGFVIVASHIYTYHTMAPLIEGRVIHEANAALREEGYRRFWFEVDNGTIKFRIVQKPITKKDKEN